MAEHNKGGLLSKAQKRLTRTKTKVLQNLGKAGKTADDQFDEHVHKLDRQQDVAVRLQKELKNYLHCARAMQNASKGLYQVLTETYEQDWKEQSHIKSQLDSMELMWNNYQTALDTETLNSLNMYISHFQPFKARIAKRNRKLDYFDNARHNCDIQQNAKKKDEAKINKAVEELEEAKTVYEKLNNDLHHDLPNFYDSRVNFYANLFSKLFNAEEIFHGEVAKLCTEITQVTDSLAKETEAIVFKPRPESTRVSGSEVNTSVNGHPENYHGNSSYESASPVNTPMLETPKSKETNESLKEDDDAVYENSHLEQKDGDKSQTVATATVNVGHEENDVTQAEVESSKTDTPSGKTEEAKVNGDIGDNMSEHSQDSAPGYPPPKPPEDEEPAVPLAKPRTSLDAKNIPKAEVKVEPVADNKSSEPVNVLKDEQENAIEPSSPVYEVISSSSSAVKNEVKGSEVKESEVTNKVEKEEEKSEEKKEEDEDDDDDDDDEEDSNVYDSPPSNQPVKLPEGVLFQVQATHPYTNEDEDELSFEAGDIINVITFENPDDQDDGWLMGIKVSDGEKGVFPENFTKRI